MFSNFSFFQSEDTTYDMKTFFGKYLNVKKFNLHYNLWLYILSLY
jgi:hypothetical protein